MAQLEYLNIDDPGAARVLVENKTARLLTPFMKRPCSLSSAAQETGVKLPTLLYHVNRFIRLGLLEVACTQRRSGRAIKIYRSTAKRFSVPFSITPSETLEQLFTELTTPETNRFRREMARTLSQLAPRWGFHVTCTEEGSISSSLSPDEKGETKVFIDAILGMSAPAVLSTEGSLQLDFETAKALQRELNELNERYRKKQKDNYPTYAFRLGLTPIQDDSFS